ncbi:UPF0426 chloroplastic [Chlorella sorokiniana]|uniref:UPF0426 chloroplastic n=1 Tax=Chlorella sorokiniana TaxID=3076 RepID=A0A2P6U3G8_CHLSO|nr:UPF0426 chloroplastic [Chlorella sorokiniana]|eukprot:PRW60851.1 UPF0426 chloroplastic [Chlorella sorokiniana]
MLSSASLRAASLPGVGLELKGLLRSTSSLPAPPRVHRDGQRSAVRAAASASGGRPGGSGSGGGGAAGSSSSSGPIDTPILKAAAGDPIAFWGGVFAGALGLDLRQDPLKTWVEQTAAEAGLRYQATVQRLEAERQARASYDP